jgi:hypothetical protein
MSAGRKRAAPRAAFRPVEQRAAAPGSNLPDSKTKSGRKGRNRAIKARQAEEGHGPILSARKVRARLAEMRAERERAERDDDGDDDADSPS